MNTIIGITLFVCVTLTYASAWPTPEGGPVGLVQPAAAVAVDDDILEGAEQRWGGRGFGGGGGFGGGRRGFGGGGGFGGGRRGFGGGLGGGRGGGRVWGG